MHKAPVIPKIYLIYLQRSALSCLLHVIANVGTTKKILFNRNRKHKDNKYNIICKYYIQNTTREQQLNTKIKYISFEVQET